MAFELTPERERVVDQLLKRYPEKRAACLPVLNLCQEQLGWVSPEVMEYVARRLDMATSEVKGVVTFYTLYHQEPVAPNVIWVCRTLSCELRGAKAIEEHLEKRLGCKMGETSPDGRFTLRKAECLAACGQAPMFQLNDRYFENLTLQKVDNIISEYEQKTPARPLPSDNKPTPLSPFSPASVSGRPSAVVSTNLVSKPPAEPHADGASDSPMSETTRRESPTKESPHG